MEFSLKITSSISLKQEEVHLVISAVFMVESLSSIIISAFGIPNGCSSQNERSHATLKLLYSKSECDEDEMDTYCRLASR